MARGEYNKDNETRRELASVQKNNRGDFIKVAELTNNTSGNMSIDIRLFYTNDDDKVLPSPKGVRFSNEILLDVLKGLAKGLEMDEVFELKDALEEMIESEDEEEGGEED